MKAITFSTEGLQCVCTICDDTHAETCLADARKKVSTLYADCFAIQSINTVNKTDHNNVWVAYHSIEDLGASKVDHIGVFASDAEAINYAYSVAGKETKGPFVWAKPNLEGFIDMGWSGCMNIQLLPQGTIDDYTKIINCCQEEDDDYIDLDIWTD